MRTPLLAFLFLAAAALLLPALPQALNAQEPHEEESVEEEIHTEELQHELETLRADLKLAMLRMDAMLVDQDLSLKHATYDRDDAVSDLQSYRALDGEASRAEAKLNLQYQKDSLADAEEELEQLGMMYDLNNLADATAQIVMERAGRNVERMKTETDMAEKALQHFLEFGEPREHRNLERAVDLSEIELASLQLSMALDRAEMERELKDLRTTIAELEEELAESKK
ncbi:MAG: hypothetical protein ACPG31_05310 [Planctomycetota bacterium]